MNLTSKFRHARAAARTLALVSTSDKNAALRHIAFALRKNASVIEAANAQDLRAGKKKNLGAKLDRLRFDAKRIAASAAEVSKVAKLRDPVGRILETHSPLAKFSLKRVAVPLGVIAVIYESRPNVTIDAVALALKAGNAVVLRGSSDALNSNRAIVKIIHAALRKSKLPVEAVQFIDSPDRRAVGEILAARGFIDVVIPRGGKNLIDFVARNSIVPIIETGASVVHLFVDAQADLAAAVRIAVNSKTRRVSICNALDTLLVHQKIAKKFLKIAIPELEKRGVKFHASRADAKFLPTGTKFTAPDFDREWLSLDLNLKIVKNFGAATAHIAAHSLGHTEAIVTRNRRAAERFTREVDAACVFANLSTQFSDGGQFGLGAEIGISTQKLHARGPFALEKLTTEKWVGHDVSGRGLERGT